MKCRCDISKCKASCCYNVPLTKYTLFTNKKRIVTSYKNLVDTGAKDLDGRELYIPTTSTDYRHNRCPFLTNDCKCNIYDKRPWICREFGESKGASKYLHCGWLEGKESDNVINNEEDQDTLLSEMMMQALSGNLKA